MKIVEAFSAIQTFVFISMVGFIVPKTVKWGCWPKRKMLGIHYILLAKLELIKLFAGLVTYARKSAQYATIQCFSPKW